MAKFINQAHLITIQYQLLTYSLQILIVYVLCSIVSFKYLLLFYVSLGITHLNLSVSLLVAVGSMCSICRSLLSCLELIFRALLSFFQNCWILWWRSLSAVSTILQVCLIFVSIQGIHASSLGKEYRLL